MDTMIKVLPTVELARAGQSPWLDFLSRDLLKNGEMKAWVETKGVLGVTSNPAIFQKAITESSGGYVKDISKFAKQGKSTLEIYDTLTIQDIRDTCDLFLPTYEKTQGEHGFVSLEVLPNLAHDAQSTISEAKRLWKAVNRPNTLIKVPATQEGVAALRELIGSGVSVNVTLMFSLKHYQDVANAYLDGLQTFHKKGGDLSKVHSVASVFVSRIDSALDKQLAQMQEKTKDTLKIEELEYLKGKAAIANSKTVYQEFKRIFSNEKFRDMQGQGARLQKVLWASTSSKNPNYSDLIYVEPLIGYETVNTMPSATLEAFLDHGQVTNNSVEQNLDEALHVVDQLEKLGLDLNAIGEGLQSAGVKAFMDAFDVLLGALEQEREKVLKIKAQTPCAQRVNFKSSPAAEKKLSNFEDRFSKSSLPERFYQYDASLWSSDAEVQKKVSNRLGWLKVFDWIHSKLYEIDALVEQVKEEKISDVVLLGMGGSSLAPEVMSLICKTSAKSPRFHVLDTTDPDILLATQKAVNLARTIFIVASKSGSTIETASQFRYFYGEVLKMHQKDRWPSVSAGRHFVAITDPGSPLFQTASEKNFRKVFVNPSDIGGRFSALSFFGMVPAALMGIDIRTQLRNAKAYDAKLRFQRGIDMSSPIGLGLALGALAESGINKLSFVLPKGIESLGTWLEQLIAESTGKAGKGIFPIVGESLHLPEAYRKDRFFVVICSSKMKLNAADTKKLAALKKAGFPVIEIDWKSDGCLAAEFYRWEVATAVCGIAMSINPFDEPNVTESKEITGKLLKELETTKKLAAPKNLLSLKQAGKIQSFLSGGQNDYVAILAFIERTPSVEKELDRLRRKIWDLCKIPVLVGIGPRYLHSIGQLYKGGPRTGKFLVISKKPKKDASVPGTKYKFSQLLRAQAFGDAQALASKKIPVLAVDFGTASSVAGLKTLTRKGILI